MGHDSEGGENNFNKNLPGRNSFTLLNVTTDQRPDLTVGKRTLPSTIVQVHAPLAS